MRGRADIVCFFSTKGGVGRTVLAANLAVSLGLQGCSTVLLDFNQCSSAASVLGMEPENSLGNLLLDEAPLKACLASYSEQVALLPAPDSPEPSMEMDAAKTVEIFEALRPLFDFIVVDLPAGLSNHVFAALEAADFIALLAGNDILSLKSAVFSLQNLALLGHDLQTVKLMINGLDRHGLSAAEIENAVGLPIFWCIDRDHRLTAALNNGRPFVVYNPRTPASVGVNRLASTLAEEFGKKRSAA